jgi:uncharacterized protein
MIKKLVFASALLALGGGLFAQSYIPVRGDKKMKVQPKISVQAYSFDLRDVKLLSGSPFKNAEEKDAAYLLAIEPNRLLHRFYLNAGLPTKGDIYGGWENGGLSGHSLGHYLSAIAMFYANSGNAEYKKRVDYIVDELATCQKARKTGYVGAIPNEDSIFAQVKRGEIVSRGFDLNGGWSPWYTVHKVMAGLVDAYLYCDNAKAIDVVVKMADWTGTIVNHLSEELRLKMLMCEYGGMNDVLVNIYAITGDAKYLKLADKFTDEFVMGQLAKRIDPMPGKHSNTNVPKAIGSARRFELTQTKADETIASFFWETMVHHHSYVIGGNSSYEYCGKADHLNDRLSDNTCETCNTYNMLKLTRHLFSWNPSNDLADYYERALYNHILASQNPEDGMMCYFVPLRMGAIKQFSDQFNTFTCCVGTGMENHVKYAESIYYEGKEGGLYVNLFIPSELNWKAKGVTVRQETKFPESNVTTLKFSSAKDQKFPVFIREPKWSAGKVQIKLNGKIITAVKNSAGYLVVDLKSGKTNEIEVSFGMDVHTESMPDNPNRIAFLYGPIVLAGQLGKTMPDPVFGTPVLLTDNRNLSDWFKPEASEPLTFVTKNVGKPFDPKMKPFYKTYDQYYSVYWDYFTNTDWTARQAEYEADKKRLQEIESRTIDNFRIGEMQPERDHNLEATDQCYVSDAYGRMGREARINHKFSFDMKVDSTKANNLLLTYFGDDKNRKFDVFVNDKLLKTVEWEGGKTGKFYDFEYPVPEEITKLASKINVSIRPNYGTTAGRIFGARTTRR